MKAAAEWDLTVAEREEERLEAASAAADAAEKLETVMASARRAAEDKLVDVVLSLEMEARGLRDASAKADEAAATADARSVQAINEVQAGCSQAATMALTRARAAKAAAAEAARAEIDAVSAAVEAMREAAQATREADEA